ncbi:hypothetical protein VTN02DRAFT_5807 [Thermoascus thermophilus]
MVQTRAQHRLNEQRGPTPPEQQSLLDGAASNTRQQDEQQQQQQQQKQENGSGAEPPPTTRAAQASGSVSTTKLRRTVDDYGALPLQGTGVREPLRPAPETLLAMVLDALLKSTRISHDLAQRAVRAVVEAGYHDVRRLRASTWDERVGVLARAGYNRYREQSATRLGDLAEWVMGEYDGDLNNVLHRADCQQQRVRSQIKQIKGLGDLGADLFVDSAQAVWPCLAPFLDARSRRTAEEVGIGTDLDAIYAALGRDPVAMSRLARGLSNVRLQRKQGVIQGA